MSFMKFRALFYRLKGPYEDETNQQYEKYENAM